MDITQLILDDHHEQRRLFAMIEQIDRGDTLALFAMWTRLSTFLEVHAKAEEAIFYPELLHVGRQSDGKSSTADETKDAIHDHNEIRDAIALVANYPIGGDRWIEALAAANNVNSDHMSEEERQGLTDFRCMAGLQMRHDLAVRFACFDAVHISGVKPVDLDPSAYVAAND